MGLKRTELKRGAPLRSRSQLARTGRLAPRSPKTIREAPLRAAVRAEALARDGGCVGPARGLPGACRSYYGRPPLEVHEVAARGTHPGSHLKVELTVCLCNYHHDACTSPVGEMRVLVESLGLLVRATS